MGWASGSYLAQDLWEDIRKVVKDKEDRKKLARSVISNFMGQDADDWDMNHRLFKDAGFKFVPAEGDSEGCRVGDYRDKDGVSPYDL